MSYQERLYEYLEQLQERDRGQEEHEKELEQSQERNEAEELLNRQLEQEEYDYDQAEEELDRVQEEAYMLLYGLDDDHDLSNGFYDEDGCY